MKFYAELSGLPEVEAALARLPLATGRKVVLAAMRRSLQPMVDDMKRRVPRRDNPKSGGYRKWKRNHKPKAPPARDTIKARTVPGTGPEGVSVAISYDPRAFYLFFRERGHRLVRNVALGSGRTREENIEAFLEEGLLRRRKVRKNQKYAKRVVGSVPPRPWMAPGFDAKVDACMLRFADELWVGLERTAKRLEKKAGAGKLSRREEEALAS